MNTRTIVEEPIFILESGSYDGHGETVNIYASDLKRADVGAEWCADDTGNCGRSCYSASVKVVYKDDDGCAVLSRRWGTTDSSDPKPWNSVPALIWIELHRTEEVGA